MTGLTRERVAELRGLLANATPGPWQQKSYGGIRPALAAAVETVGFVLGTNKDGSMSKRHTGQLPVFYDATGRRKRMNEDIALIVAAVNDLPELLALADEALARREADAAHDAQRRQAFRAILTPDDEL